MNATLDINDDENKKECNKMKSRKTINSVVSISDSSSNDYRMISKSLTKDKTCDGEVMSPVGVGIKKKIELNTLLAHFFRNEELSLNCSECNTKCGKAMVSCSS